MMKFVKAEGTKSLSDGDKMKIKAEGKELLLANIDGTYYAIDNKCPHMGGSLADGNLENDHIVCPRHGSAFDVKTGKAVHGGGYHYSRSVASAGALYPVEIYVATHDVRELQDGLYHFSIANHALIPLRNEDVTGFVDDSFHETIEKRPSLIFLFK